MFWVLTFVVVVWLLGLLGLFLLVQIYVSPDPPDNNACEGVTQNLIWVGRGSRFASSTGVSLQRSVGESPIEKCLDFHGRHRSA